jgi:hypothetical protein
LYQRLKSPVPLSSRSPQAVLIDLEQLDLAPEALLTELGIKLISVFEDAGDVSLNLKKQSQNAAVLAKVCAEAVFEVNHRRLFVKSWVDFLFSQLVDGESDLTEEDAKQLIWTGQQTLTEVAETEDEFDDF